MFKCVSLDIPNVNRVEIIALEIRSSQRLKLRLYRRERYQTVDLNRRFRLKLV
jgi:hypothetical protein